MKIIDSFDLPEAVLDAIRNDPYHVGEKLEGTVGIYSPSSMLTPPQIRALYREHADEIEEEAVTRVWSLLGKAVHNILEQAALKGPEVPEERYFSRLSVTTDKWEGQNRYSVDEEWTISGMLDNQSIAQGKLNDYKVTSSWTIVNGGRDEWEWQLNVYAWLARQNGIELNELWIHAILRDWSWSQALKSDSYPDKPIISIPIKLHPDGVIEAWMRDRIALHQEVPTPECTDEDRWYKGSRYAIRKVGNKRAIRVMDTLSDLARYADDKDLVVMDHGLTAGFGVDESTLDLNMTKGDHYVVERIGENIRCERYCSVVQFCEQAKRMGIVGTMKAYGGK